MGRATSWTAMRASLVASVAALGCAAMGTAACGSETGGAKVTVAGLKADLDAHLPPGSRSSEVEAYLAHKGIEHSGLTDMAKSAHMGFDPDTYEMYSMVRNVRRSFFVTTDIRAVFVFDREKKLLRTRVEEVHTGL